MLSIIYLYSNVLLNLLGILNVLKQKLYINLYTWFGIQK